MLYALGNFDIFVSNFNYQYKKKQMKFKLVKNFKVSKAVIRARLNHYHSMIHMIKDYLTRAPTIY